MKVDDISTDQIAFIDSKSKPEIASSQRAATMADSGGGSCLSDLSDDLLRHILSFTAASDRAATSVLSRRWLRLWRSSGDVYLDSRSFNGGCSSPDQETEAFLRGAKKALAVAAAHGPIRRLTISIAEDSKIIRSWSERNRIDTLVSNLAARRVEELKIEVKPWNTRCCEVSFGSLPSEALRVLRLIDCRTVTAPLRGVAAAFPMLAELHLQGCNVTLVAFQTIVDAAPQLSTLHLASSSVDIPDNGDEEPVVGRLCIPAVTDLVVADFGYYYGESILELDVPRLQYFRYKGHFQHTNGLSLKPQASSNLVQVELHLTYDYNAYGGSGIPTRNLFWQFIKHYKTTKHLKLKLDKITMDDFALNDMASQDELLGGLSFDLLEQLQLEADYRYKPGFQGSMVMLANLLHCCPKVRDLKLRFGKCHEIPCWIEYSIGKEAAVHFDKSVNGFRNRRRKSIMVSVGGKNDVNYYEAFGIPGLTGEHSFSCLQSHLQTVSLHFFMEEPNCLEVQLARFFAENAKALQQMHIDDGSHEMLEHVNSSVKRWIANTHNGSNQLNVVD